MTPLKPAEKAALLFLLLAVFVLLGIRFAQERARTADVTVVGPGSEP